MVIEPSTHPASNGDGSATEALFSLFHDDAEMSEILDDFLRDMLGRMQEMHTALEQGDVHRLARINHKIKGVAGGYGFPMITDAAEQIERCLMVSGTVISPDCHAQMKALRRLIERAYVTRLRELPGTGR